MSQPEPLQSESYNTTGLEIPWMKRWEKETALARAAAEDDPMERMLWIDYMAMLEEIRI